MTNDHGVALIEPVGGHGGMDYYDLGLCRGLVAAGRQVSWYTCDETVAPEIAGVNFQPVFKGIFGKQNRWIRGFRYLAGSFMALSRAIRLSQTICHFHFFHGSMEELSLLLLAKISGRRVVITVHDVESFAGGGKRDAGLIGRLYRLADRLIVHNFTSRDALISALRVPAAKIVIIPHGNYLATIDTVPSSRAAKQELGIDSSRRIILFFGQIKDVKGLDLLIEALPAVVQAHPEVLLVIAGRPWKADLVRYEQLIEELAMQDYSSLHARFILDKQVSTYYAAAEIVVLPYRRIYQSGVILLAMSYGKPVMVSDLPGMLEVITEGENGFVFRRDSSADLAVRLIQVLGDEAGLRRVGDRALVYVEKHHDWLEIGRRTVEVYRSLEG